MPAASGLEGGAAAGCFDQFDRRNSGHAEQSRVTFNLCCYPGQWTPRPIDRNCSDPPHAARICARLANHMPAQHLGALRHQQVE